MRPNLSVLAVMSLVLLAAVIAPAGCEEKKPAPASTAASKADGHGHDRGPNGEHAAHRGDGGAGHGGPVIALGEQAIGPFSARATRDQGQIVAGKDAPIDVTVTPAADATVKAAAVRFWIGTEDARGSVKARAEIENPQEPNRWHVHAEIPSPIPAGSRLWVEIEDDQGGMHIGSFDLKM